MTPPAASPAMRALAACLVAVAFLAGCIGTEEPPTLAAQQDAAASDAAADASTAATPPAQGTTAAAPAAVERVVPVVYEGSLRTGAFVCDPNLPDGCVGESLPGDGEGALVRLPFEGTLKGGLLNVTWEAATPATATLAAYVIAGESCGDDCITNATLVASAEGESPLVLDTGALDGPYGIAYVHVVEPRPDAPVFYRLTLEQAYAVDGALRVV